jgi:ubiquinone/menaquinone biosynthesis C-methylase UbiE
MNNKNTSWGGVASWYDEHLDSAGTYHKELVLPNVLRLLSLKKGDVVLDLACGQGFFSREFYKAGATVHASDIAKELIEIAKHNSPKNITFYNSPAHEIGFLEDKSVDKIVIILAVQNIENIQEVFVECKRVLKDEGRLLIVMNHPTFRVPKASSWGWDEEGKVQYRRIDGYMSETRTKIAMDPGKSGKHFTVSFHRPLQVYMKALSKAGFALYKLEEWISHKESKPGPRAIAENVARKEIPLFMCLEAAKK